MVQSVHILEIRGLEPLLFRDGRPFTAELGAQHANSLAVPLPGTIAGAVRTMVGERLGWKWDAQASQRARAIGVHGPIVCLDRTPVVAAPADAVILGEPGASEEGLRVIPLRPRRLSPGAGCNAPSGIEVVQVDEDEKPARGYAFWRWQDMLHWLGDPETGSLHKLPAGFPNIGLPTVEVRVHAMIGAEGVAEHGMLFTTTAVSPLEPAADTSAWSAPRPWSYLVRMQWECDMPVELAGGLLLGGERRLAAVEPLGMDAWPQCPDRLAAALKGASLVRMMLVTPALFRDGWRPGWLEGGSPPGVSGLQVELRSACVKRREPVSGWDYQHGQPKAVRWLAPAGSVYFFKASGATENLANEGWLAPVSDDPQDRLNGYGLAVWGVWGCGADGS